MTAKDLEARTQEIGREIFARVREDRPATLSAQWWDEQMMSLTMRDELVKIQLFRFVDALPSLSSPVQIASHLREYLGQASGRLPGALRALIEWLPEDGWAGGLLAGLARFNAQRLARRFIAGTDVRETLATITELRRSSLAFTIDLLGEAVLSEAEAEEYQRQYLRFIDGICAAAEQWPANSQIDRDHVWPMPRVNISVKLSSLYSQFDAIDPEGTSRAVCERLRPILRLARERGVFVNIDMEQYAFKDVTLRIFQEVFEESEFRNWGNVGIAIQAYLQSCGDDLSRLAGWVQRRGTPVWVRLVKGAYWDFETIVASQNGWPVPVFSEKAATDENFEKKTAFLIEHRDLLRPAIASHNVRSLAHSLALLEQHDVPPRQVEFQMLYGMADPIKSALVSMGQRVRVYTPFGRLLPGMAYLVRRLLENTSNQSFLRAGFLEHVPLERLLMNPSQLMRDMPARPQNHRAISFANEPLCDFSREENCRAMRRALDEVADRLGQTYPLVINGRRLSRERTIDSVNPSHCRQIVGRCASATMEDAHLAVSAAAEAFLTWRNVSAERRADYLMKAAEILRRRRFELSAWEVYECGKQWREADADVAEAIDYCEYYAREMLRLARPQTRDVPGEENSYFYEPRGVAIIIAPWNFPLAILCGMTAAAVVAGNTAIMKPAEQSSVIAAKLMEVFEEANFPPGVVNFLPGIGEEIGPVLVSHRDVALIAFTGSRAVGLSIGRQAAETPSGQEYVKRVITEMGGKNAIIVDDDADLDEAVHGVAASAFGYAGQKCSACSRVIVLDSIYDAFLNRLIEVTRSLHIGPAEEPANFIGPVIDDQARRRILETIESAKKESRLAFAGDISTLSDDGFYVAPHIFTDVDPNSSLAQQEIFGPVLAAIRASDLGDALCIANGTPYSLTGGIYSRSPRNIAIARREFRVGNLYINRKITGALVDRQPFGGFKLSGIGLKAGGPDYLQQFLVPRCVTENTLRHGFAPVAESSTNEHE